MGKLYFPTWRTKLWTWHFWLGEFVVKKGLLSFAYDFLDEVNEELKHWFHNVLIVLLSSCKGEWVFTWLWVLGLFLLWVWRLVGKREDVKNHIAILLAYILELDRNYLFSALINLIRIVDKHLLQYRSPNIKKLHLWFAIQGTGQDWDRQVRPSSLVITKEISPLPQLFYDASAEESLAWTWFTQNDCD